MSYKAPGVYTQDVVSGSKSTSQASSSVGVLIGVTRSGKIGVAQEVNSWTEYISKYANGLDTPFLENSYLPHAVHGFFTNGGKELYIISVKKNAVKATKTSTTNKIKATALTEGVWGNEIKVSIKKSADYDESTNKCYDVTIAVGTSESVVISDVTFETISDMVLKNNKVRYWLGEFSVDSTTVALAEEEFVLASGSDGDELADEDYTEALDLVEPLNEVLFVAIPGQTSNTVNSAILAYCDKNGMFPIIDMPMSSTTEDTKLYRKGLNAFTGVLCHPWGKVIDPLTNTLKAVPTCGHVMGVYARTIETRGIHKAPAGVDAVVHGFVEMEYPLTPTQIGTLNSVGVACVTARPNAGIVIWGVRSLNSKDDSMKYVSDGMLNLNIKKYLYDATQFAVFEPNNEQLWSKVQATCKAFLETLRTSGALKGTAKEAYFVTVDATNNTDATIENGELHIEVGYAPSKPAEFVVIKLAHSIVS